MKDKRAHVKIVAKSKLILTFAAVIFISVSAFSYLKVAQGQSPAEFLPNDPRLDPNQARVSNLLAAYADILRIEQTGQPKMPSAVIAMLDDWVDCSHPEFQGKCLANLTFNATDQPYQNSHTHGMASAGTGMADTDNHMGVASTGGLSSRLRFFPVKVCDGDLCKPEWVQAGLAYVLQMKRSGVPIVVIGCNFASGVVDAAGMDRLLKDLNAEQIDIVAPGPNNLPAQNIDEFNIFPVTYVDQYPNIISVTAADSSGQQLLPASAYGPKRMNLTALGDSVKTISILDPVNGAGSISGSSAVTEQIAAEYALIRLYRDSTSAGARFILKFTARMYPALEGRLNAGPGAGDDAGRLAGKIDVHDALTLPFGCPAPSSVPMLVSKRDSNLIIAVDSVFFTKGPFVAQGLRNLLTPDKQTRIIIFAYNINLLPGETPSAIVVQETDSSGHTGTLPVEFESKLSGALSCLSQITVKLTPQAPLTQLAAGDVVITVSFHGQTTSPGVITILAQ